MLVNSSPVPVRNNPRPVAAGPAREPGQKPVLRMAHLTDIHVKPDRTAEYGMAAALQAVNNLHEPVNGIINGGDAIMNAVALSKSNVKSQWNTFHSILRSETSLPVYHCVGNHDLFGWMLPSANHEDGKKWCMDEYAIQKTYYAFTCENWKFVVLDNIHPRKSVPGYLGKIDDEQFYLLENELKNTPEGQYVCIVSHIPILAICCFFEHDITNLNKRTIGETNMHTDSEKLVELFYRYPAVRTCISGHIHLIDYVNYLGVDYYCNGAVSGHWWRGNHHHFPPSFSVMNFYKDGTTHREVVYYSWEN